MKQTETTLLVILFFLSTNLFSQDVQAPYVAGPKFEKEIKKIRKDKSVQKALAYIESENERNLDELILLTEIPAPPFKEGQRAEVFLKLVAEAGADSVWIDEVGNVVGLVRGTNSDRTIALDAHLDTVFPEGTDVTVKYNGDTLIAPGIGDDTRGLVVVLSTLRALKAADLHLASDLWIVGSVGEEGLGDLRGVKHLFKEGAHTIDSWISVDGGEIGRIANKGLGSYRYKVSFLGPGGHSWGAFGLGNPHHGLGLAIQKFDSAAAIFTESGPRTSYNVGRIGGGTSVNSIPFESWMEVDMRSISPESLDSIDFIFKESMNAALVEINSKRRRGEELTLKIEKIGDRPSGSQDASLPLIQRAIAATNSFGVNPRLGTGSTNSNTPIAVGVPAVTIGRGGIGGGAHSLDEWWINQDSDNAIGLALLLVIAEAGLD